MGIEIKERIILPQGGIQGSIKEVTSELILKDDKLSQEEEKGHLRQQ